MSTVDEHRATYSQTHETIRQLDRDVSMGVSTLTAVESVFRAHRRGDDGARTDDELSTLESVLAEWDYDTGRPTYDQYGIDTPQELQTLSQQAFDMKHSGSGDGGTLPGGGSILPPGFGADAGDALFDDVVALVSFTIDGGGDTLEALRTPLEYLETAYESGDEPTFVGAHTTIAEGLETAIERPGDLRILAAASPMAIGLEALETVQDDDGRADVLEGFEAGIDDPDDAEAFWAARETVSNAIGALEQLATDSRNELTTLTGSLAAEYTDDLGDSIDALGDSPDETAPIVMLPTRLETRFAAIDSGLELLVRIYPDDIHVDTHERELTETEIKYGRRFWELTLWASQDVSAATLESSTDSERLEDVSFESLPTDPDRRHEAVLERVWTQLVDRFGEERAAWVKHVCKPDGGDAVLEGPQDPNELPDVDFDALADAIDRRPSSWTRPPRARCLPDCWIAFAETEAGTTTAVSEPIRTPLSIGPDPGALDTATEVADEADIRDGELDWLFHFDDDGDVEDAIDAGMGLRIPLPEFDADADATVDRLVVIGVSTVEDAETTSRSLSELLDAHHYTDGLSMIERETPTNDTRKDDAGSEPSGTASAFERECRPPVATFGDETDGGLAGRLLGIDPDHLGETGQFAFGRIPGAGRTEDAHAATVHTALWPATLGYYIPHMLAPHAWIGVDDPGKEHLLRWLEGYRRHFVAYVRGGGPLATLRVGNQPYGIVPTTDVRSDSWKQIHDYRVNLNASSSIRASRDPWIEARDVEVDLVGRLDAVRTWWEEATNRVPTAATETDSAAFLAELLALSGTGYGYRLRNLVSHSTLIEFVEGLDGVDVDDLDLDLGDDPLLSEIVESDLLPRIDTLYGNEFAPVIGADLVPDELDGGLEGLRTRNFGWLRLGIPTAGDGDVGELDLHALLEAGDLTLLEALTYLGLLQEARLARYRMEIHHGGSHEHDQEDGTDTPGSLFPEPTGYESESETLWAALEDTVPAGLEKFPDVDADDSYRDVLEDFPDIDPAYGAFYDALADLEEIDPAVVERLLRETLDLASHRFDAWATSVATRRLDGMRENDVEGVFVGAYGYVENLDRRVGDQSKGYVHAPSIGQATTAAVLRSVHAARHDAYDDMLAIDLSADRVREARAIVDAVRVGHQLGAQLGYQFERGLHERSRKPADELDEPVELDRYVYPFRSLAPLVVGKLEGDDPSETNAESESDTDSDDSEGTQSESDSDAAEREVVDGVALLDAWAGGGEDDSIPWGDPTGSEEISLPETGTAEHDAIETELASLAATLDAVRDVLTAESVHQLVSGQPERAGASLDALSRGETPSTLEVTKTPRTGTSCTHRLVALLDGEQSSQWATDRPRAVAEPALESWVSGVLGDPSLAVCRVAYRTPVSDEDDEWSEWHVVAVRLSALSLCALDVLYLVDGDDEAWGSELEARVEYRLRRSHPEITDESELRLSFAPPDEWDDPESLGVDPEDAIGFGPLLEVARSVRDLVTSARPVDARDLRPPGEGGGRGIDESVLTTRVDDGADTLETRCTDRLDAQLAAFTDPTRDDDVSPAAAGDPLTVADRLTTLVDGIETLPSDVLERLGHRLDELDRDAAIAGLEELLAVAAGETAVLEREDDGVVPIEQADPRVRGCCVLDESASITVSVQDPDASTVATTAATVDERGRFEAVFDAESVTGESEVAIDLVGEGIDTKATGKIVDETGEQSVVDPAVRTFLSVVEAAESVVESLEDERVDAAIDTTAIEAAAETIDASEWPASGDEADLRAVFDTLVVPLPGIEDPPMWNIVARVVDVLSSGPLEREGLEVIEEAIPDSPSELGLAGSPGEESSTVPAVLGPVIDSFDAAQVATTAGIEAAARRPDDGFVAASLEVCRSGLAVAAAFGVHGSVPLVATDNSRDALERLFTQVESVLEECSDRLEAAEATPETADGSVTALEALFGESFTVLPPFSPTNADELASTLDAGHSERLQRGDPLAAETWFARLSRIREGVDRFSETLAYGERLGEHSPTDGPRFRVGQLPYEADDTWVGLPEAWTDQSPAGRLSIVAHTTGPSATETDELVGLFVDEYVETVPNETETTGVSVHYDAPTNRAPQTVLLAVPPTSDGWSIETLKDVVIESVDLAKCRTVDRDALAELGHLVPGLTVPTNDRSTLPVPDTGSIPPNTLAPLFGPNVTVGGGSS